MASQDQNTSSPQRHCVLHKVHLQPQGIVCLRIPTQRKHCCTDQSVSLQRPKEPETITLGGKKLRRVNLFFGTRPKKKFKQINNLVLLSPESKVSQGFRFLLLSVQTPGQFTRFPLLPAVVLIQPFSLSLSLSRFFFPSISPSAFVSLS